MSDEEPTFRLAEIQAGLGLEHAEQAKRRIGNAVPVSALHRGKPVKAWRLSALPKDVQDELEQNRALHVRRSVEDLLQNPPPLYRPSVNPTSEQLRDAERLRDALAPVLRNRGEKSWVRLIEEALPRMGADAPKERQMEYLLKRTIDRDANWERFDRLELYFCDATRTTLTLESEEPEMPLLEEILAGLDSRVSNAESVFLWEAIFQQWKALCGQKLQPQKAQAQIFARISAPGAPFAAFSREALRKQWTRKLSKWSAGNLQDNRKKSGRSPKFGLTDAEKRSLRKLVLLKGSFSIAVEWFAKSPACLPETRTMIIEELDRAARLRRKPSWAPSLRQAGHVTVEEEAAFRGTKAMQDVAFQDRRGMYFVDERGEKQGMRPNTIWESDDMSSNEPFTWTEEGPHGEPIPRIGRQTLCTIDVYSGAFLAAMPIGRERDAYRAEDIADHFAECVEANGLPFAWRLERGPWENNFIDGIKVGVDNEGCDIRWGGLDPIIHICRAWTSKQKGTIESSFDLLQSLLAHESISIGRHRGEFEAATKLFLAAGRGDIEAWRKFWPINQAAEGFANAMEAFNQRPKQRRAFGRDLVAPADLYRNAERRECPASELWRFCPVKDSATVRGGHIEKTIRNYPLPFRFRINGVKDGMHLENGSKVLVAFHPGHPERGCHVFNAARQSREGWKFGEFLLTVPMAEDAPQVSLSKVEKDAFAVRRKANAAVRSEFRGIIGGKRAAKASTARDGFGNSKQLRNTERREPISPVAAARNDGDEMIRQAKDEEAELSRIKRLEDEAFERGDLIPSVRIGVMKP